jgi:hypothetical protein
VVDRLVVDLGEVMIACARTNLIRLIKGEKRERIRNFFSLSCQGFSGSFSFREKFLRTQLGLLFPGAFCPDLFQSFVSWSISDLVSNFSHIY